MRLLLILAAALSLLAAACGDDDEAATTTTTSSSTTTTEAPTSTTSTTDPSAPALDASCTSPDGFTIAYPEDWEAVSDCGQFGPAPIEEPTPNTDDRTGIVSAFIDPVAFDQVSATVDGEQDRTTTTVDGREAVRFELETTGDGLYPAGNEGVIWMVDASAETGDEPATLFVDAYDLGFDADFDEAVSVMDAMVDTVELGTAPADGDGGPEIIGETGTETVESDGFPTLEGDTALLTDVRVSAQDGFDRVVLEFDGDDPPSYRVGFIDPPVRADGSGNEVDVEGDAFLEVRATPAAGYDPLSDDAEQTYTGPDRIAPDETATVQEVVEIGDFESNLGWVIGLDREAGFAVEILQDPLRLVVDVAAGDS